jgi:hypothetical protein
MCLSAVCTDPRVRAQEIGYISIRKGHCLRSQLGKKLGAYSRMTEYIAITQNSKQSTQPEQCKEMVRS